MTASAPRNALCDTNAMEAVDVTARDDRRRAMRGDPDTEDRREKERGVAASGAADAVLRQDGGRGTATAVLDDTRRGSVGPRKSSSSEEDDES